MTAVQRSSRTMSSRNSVSSEGVFGVTSSACLHSPSGLREAAAVVLHQTCRSAVNYSAVSYNAYSTDAP